MAKVAIIGAGSVEVTRSILADLCSYDEMYGEVQIALHDIDPERLAYAERAANQIVERTGAGYEVSAHRDRRPAFDGADYLMVVNKAADAAKTFDVVLARPSAVDRIDRATGRRVRLAPRAATIHLDRLAPGQGELFRVAAPR